jgi:glycosyltransferase involved in cell wall biosynthesis
MSRDARLFFVSSELRRTLCASLAAPLGARLERQSAVRLPAVSLPDAEARRSAAAPWLKNEGTAYAVLAGRMVESKRFALGLRAAATTPLDTLVIGDGPERARLESVANRLPSTIRFLGRLNRVETLGLIEQAAVLLHPSAAEAAPTVVLEARALGVPVVACPAGDLALWATTDDGLHVVSPDPLSIAREIRRTLLS